MAFTEILLKSINIMSLLPTFFVISIAGTTLPITAYSAFRDHDSWTKKILLPISSLFLLGFLTLITILLIRFFVSDDNFIITFAFVVFICLILIASVLLGLFICFASIDINRQKSITDQTKKQIFNENFESINVYMRLKKSKP